MKIFFALPAYNEELSLPKLLESFAAIMRREHLDYHVVIVDDGSKDRTREVISEWSARMPLDLVIHPQNRGLGETIRDALRRASELAKPDDIIVTMDADNSHDPALIPEMMQMIAAGKDLVIASRYRKGAAVVGLSPFRHLTSYGARAIFQVTFPIRGVRDYTCGFRAYRASSLKQAFEKYGDSLVTERGFACMAEILLRLSKMNLRMGEVPMVLRYDKKEGVSKMNVGATVKKTLLLIARMRFAP